MSIFDLFKKEKEPEKEPDMPDLCTPPELDAIIEAFRKETVTPAVTLKVSRGKADPYSSKLGGTPYLSPGFEYPRSKNPLSEERPLCLLAQLNFAELPKLPDFPQ